MAKLGSHDAAKTPRRNLLLVAKLEHLAKERKNHGCDAIEILPRNLVLMAKLENLAREPNSHGCDVNVAAEKTVTMRRPLKHQLKLHFDAIFAKVDAKDAEGVLKPSWLTVR